MIFVSGIGIFVFIFFYICTIPYKKTLRKKLNRKEHSLLFMYGLSMFIVDRIPDRITYSKGKVDRALRELTVKENIKKEKYLYLVQKTSVSLLVIIGALILGLAMSIAEKGDSANDIKELVRDKEHIKTYEFVAKNSKGKEDVVINVESVEKTEQEIRDMLDAAQEELISRVLGENKDIKRIERNLNLVDRIGDDIAVYWDISDTSVVDYNGQIQNGIYETGNDIRLMATMILDEVSADYVFDCTVFPSIEEKSLQQKLQNYVDESDKYSEKIVLPETIDNQKIQYEPAVETYSGWILIIGMVAAVAIFILKDIDLNKEIKERNYQMMSDYPEIIGKILLYYNAGLSVKSSIERIVAEYKKEKNKNKKIFRFAYEEMEMTLTKMKSGVSEINALNEYGNRCGLHCYIKFAGIMEQNLRRGSREVSYALKSELNNAMFERKNAALKLGGEMSTKLLGPMILMLIISIMIIMVPALWSINI